MRTRRQLALSTRLKRIEELASDLGRELDRGGKTSAVHGEIATAIKAEIDAVIFTMNRRAKR